MLGTEIILGIFHLTFSKSQLFVVVVISIMIINIRLQFGEDLLYIKHMEIDLYRSVQALEPNCLSPGLPLIKA